MTTTTSSSVSRLDIERIRIPAERIAAAQLGKQEKLLRDEYRPIGPEALRRETLSRALLLTESMAEKAYVAAHEAMSRLEVDDRIEIYQGNSRNSIDTARLAVTGNPIGVELIGNVLGSLDHACLVALFGHEIGHAIAHSMNPEFAWALDLSQEAITPARRLYSLSAELTADRFGVLACRDVNVALRLEMHMTAGAASLSLKLDTDAYLAQCRVMAEQTIAAGTSMVGTTHPEHYIRGYAEWLFAETDFYREVTGKGAGSMKLDEANALISKLLRIELITPKPAAPQPLPLPMPLPAMSTLPASASSGPPSTPPMSVKESLRTKVLQPTGNAIGRLTDGVMPSLKAYATAAFGKEKPVVSSTDPEDMSSAIDDDPLAEDDRDFMARFEALDKKNDTDTKDK